MCRNPFSPSQAGVSRGLSIMTVTLRKMDSKSMKSLVV